MQWWCDFQNQRFLCPAMWRKERGRHSPTFVFAHRAALSHWHATSLQLETPADTQLSQHLRAERKPFFECQRLMLDHGSLFLGFRALTFRRFCYSGFEEYWLFDRSFFLATENFFHENSHVAFFFGWARNGNTISSSATTRPALERPHLISARLSGRGYRQTQNRFLKVIFDTPHLGG